MFSSLFTSAIPIDCILCGMTSDNQMNICSICSNNLPAILNPCKYCGIEMGLEASEISCGSCILKRPVYNQCMGVMTYTSPADYLVSRFKFNADFAAGLALGELLAIKMQKVFEESAYPDALIPIPLHRARLKERGFNQTMLLAKQVSRLTKVPVLKYSLRRIKNTKAQTTIGHASSRMTNLKNAFACPQPSKMNGVKRVALIDDVVTTQATISEASRILFLAGVEEVRCYCIARAAR